MSDIVFGGWSDTWRTDLGYASVCSPGIRTPPQMISYTPREKESIYLLNLHMSQSTRFRSLNRGRSRLGWWWVPRAGAVQKGEQNNTTKSLTFPNESWGLVRTIPYCLQKSIYICRKNALHRHRADFVRGELPFVSALPGHAPSSLRIRSW